jgi:hypothetical protein
VARQPSKKDVASSEKPIDDVAPEDQDVELTEDELDEEEELEEEGLEEDDDLEDEDEVEDDEIEDDAAASSDRSAQADAMWEDLRIQPVEIALPKGVGYTLRAYRLNTELTPTEVQEEEDAFAILRRPGDEPVEEPVEEIEITDEEIFSEEFAEVAEQERPSSRRKRKNDSPADEDLDDADTTAAESDAESDDDVAELEESGDEDDEESEDDEDDESEDDEEEAEEEAEAEEEPEPEEVPAFLGHRGRLFLFRSAEELVAFVKSDAEHDLTQLDTWESAKTRITVSSVVPTDEDRYELDLVVENLRGGRDAWDSDLLISAGEVARDLAHALRLEAVRTALSPGSPLDDLDEALRADANGGVSGFFARRRLKKIGAQQAALGWRTIIGKISAAVDWRD